VVVETWALQSPEYNRHLRRRHGDRWPFGSGEQTALPLSVDTLKLLAQTGDLFYLHPSFGVFFEYFHLQPQGMLYRLLPFSGTELLPPLLSEAVIAENEAFWKQAADEVFPKLTRYTAPSEPGSKPTLRRQLLEKLRIPEDSHVESRTAGSLISRSLNYWAVEIQKTGDLEKGAAYFDLAIKLNPDNVVAQANLNFNRKFRAGERGPVVMPKSIQERFGENYRSLDQLLGANGPFDEPDLCYAQGFTFIQQGQLRQAAAAFERVHAFAPDDLPSRLWLGQLNLLAQQPDRTLALTRDILENPNRFQASSSNRVDALALTARAHFARQETNQAVSVLETAVKRSATNQYLLASVTGIYSEQGRFSNALAIVERQLQLKPNDPAALLNKGFCHIQMNAFPEAIQAMTRLLTLETNNPNARLNRAIAYLRNDQLDAARADYESLQTQFPDSRQVYYGLGEIAYRRKDTNLAIQHYEAYRSNAVPEAAETKFVEQRLQELRGVTPDKP
jgi:tetratricopeptide (TPR) repeat protein